MALTNIEAKNAKHRDKDYKLSDEKGMYLLVKKSGAKYWRLKYRFGGKENVLALGVYSDVSLAKARKLRSAARDLLEDGKDPSIERRKAKLKEKLLVANTFQSVGVDWHRVRSEKWSERHADDVLSGLKERYFSAHW